MRASRILRLQGFRDSLIFAGPRRLNGKRPSSTVQISSHTCAQQSVLGPRTCSLSSLPLNGHGSCDQLKITGSFCSSVIRVKRHVSVVSVCRCVVVSLSRCLGLCSVSVSLSASRSVSLSTSLSFSVSLCLSLRLSLSLSVSLCLSLCLSVCVSLCVSLCVCVCL